MVGAGRTREPRLLVAADGADHPCTGPTRELDRGVPDGARTAGDQHGLTGKSPGLESAWAEVRDRQTAVCGRRGDSEAGADVEREPVRQARGLTRRKDDKLLRCSVSALPGCLPEPDTLADTVGGDARSDGVDRPCPILIRHDLWKRKLFALVCSAARLPVGRIHARDLHPDSDFTGSRFSDRPLDQVEHVRATRFRIDDRSHLTPLVVISISVVRAARLAMTRVGNPGCEPTKGGRRTMADEQAKDVVDQNGSQDGADGGGRSRLASLTSKEVLLPAAATAAAAAAAGLAAKKGPDLMKMLGGEADDEAEKLGRKGVQGAKSQLASGGGIAGKAASKLLGGGGGGAPSGGKTRRLPIQRWTD